MLGLQQAMMMQNVDVSSVHKVIYTYPLLTRHTNLTRFIYTVLWRYAITEVMEQIFWQ